MVVIVFLLSLGAIFSVTANEYFSPEQREEAHAFIQICFERLEAIQRLKQQEFQEQAARAERLANRFLSAEQIDYRKLKELDAQHKALFNDALNAETYEQSLVRPKEQISSWDPEEELKAKTLLAYMGLTNEWQQYKRDPSGIRAYGQLHKQMVTMARMIVVKRDNPADGNHIFVGGTHAYPSESDEHVNYDVDRVFFLALYLLDKELSEQ